MTTGYISEWLDSYVALVEGLTPVTRVEGGRQFVHNPLVPLIIDGGTEANMTEYRNFGLSLGGLESNWEQGDPTVGSRAYIQSVTLSVLYLAQPMERWEAAKVIAEDAGQIYWALTRSANRPAPDANGECIQVLAVGDVSEMEGASVLTFEVAIHYSRIWS